MVKTKRRTAMTIITMVILAAVVIPFYYKWSNRTELPKETIIENPSELELLLNRDLQKNYPDTAREVVKLYSNILKNLYSGLEDAEVEILAIKIRDLYDDELLDKNPLEIYKRDLYSEIAAFNQVGRKITNFILTNKDNDIYNIVDGKEYAIIQVSYTLQEKRKELEIRRFVLRKNSEGKWKILGWETQENS